MNISDKKTTLDDSAAIYQRREEKSDRAKWKDLKGFQAKWEHFKAYYLLKTFIWVCVIALGGYAVYEMFAPEKEQMLYAAILDMVIMDQEKEVWEEEFGTYISLDEETQEVRFDNTIMISNDRDGSSTQKFMAHAYAGRIDIVIARESVLKQYAGHYLRPLSDQLPADLYEDFSELYCYAAPENDDGSLGKEEPYGIYITDYVEGSPYNNEPIVLAISGNSKCTENAEAFVRYLYEKGPKKDELPES